MSQEGYNKEQLTILNETAATKLDISNVLVAFKQLQKEVANNFNFALNKTKKEFENNLEFHKEIKHDYLSLEKEYQNKIKNLRENISIASSNYDKIDKSVQIINRDLASMSTSLKKVEKQTDSNHLKFVTFSKSTETNLNCCVTKLDSHSIEISKLKNNHEVNAKKISIIDTNVSIAKNELIDLRKKQLSIYEELKQLSQDVIRDIERIDNKFKSLDEAIIKSNLRIDSTLEHINDLNSKLYAMDMANTKFHNNISLILTKHSKKIRILIGMGILIIVTLIYLLVI